MSDKKYFYKGLTISQMANMTPDQVSQKTGTSVEDVKTFLSTISAHDCHKMYKLNKTNVYNASERKIIMTLIRRGW